MVIQGFQKQRILLAKTDPIRANVLMLLINELKKIEKEKNRDVTQEDIESVASKQIKAYEKTVRELSPDSSLSKQLNQEIKILKEFLPVLMTVQETEAAVFEFLQTVSQEEINSKNMGNLMKSIKEIKGIDMSVASKTLRDYIISKES